MMHPASPMPGMPVAWMPTTVTPSPVSKQGEMLPAGWAEVIDTNSGRTIWVNAATDRVVFNRISMYIDEPSPSPIVVAVNNK